MLAINEALGRVLAEISPMGAEPVSINQAFGRILSEDLCSTIQVPGFDNSAMDGYAVRAEDTVSGECLLRIVEVIPAGKAPVCRLGVGEAAAVMTGAPIPEGADAVVIVENTDGAQQGDVQIRKVARLGDHIRKAGQDVDYGDIVLRRGDILGAAQVGLAASIGLCELKVSRRPQVAILSTGDEIVAPGQPLLPGQIYSSNTLSLAGLVLETGCEAIDLGNVADDLEAIIAALERALAADIVITTGGVSVGSFDFVKEAFTRLGVEMDFWKVAMKPGKPLAFGWAERGGRRIPLFGLPGNPVSCMVNFIEFVRPYLWMSMGRQDGFTRVVEAVSDQAFKVRPGRTKFERVCLYVENGVLRCKSTGNQSSGVLTSMARADGLLYIPASSSGYDSGDKVRVQLTNPNWLSQSSPVFKV